MKYYLEQLRAVLCDPEGVVCIHGSPADRAVIQRALDALSLIANHSATPLQPIETAPRDGTFVLLFGPSGYTSTSLRAAVCRFREGYVSPWRNHAGDAFTDGGPPPTYWMPLPAAPASPYEEAVNAALDKVRADIKRQYPDDFDPEALPAAVRKKLAAWENEKP